VNKEASHYVRLFGDNKIGNFIFLTFPRTCQRDSVLVFFVLGYEIGWILRFLK
jgi:hypothetical protein